MSSSTTGIHHGNRKSKKRVVLDYLDDLEPPTPLHKKVRAMDEKRGQSWLGDTPPADTQNKLDGNRDGHGNGHLINHFPDPHNPLNNPNPLENPKPLKGPLNQSHSGEELPVIVLSEELLSRINVDAHDVRAKCRHLTRNYEQSHLHLLFESAEDNFRFRLYVYAVAHGLGSCWSRDPVHTRLLKQVLQMLEPRTEEEGQDMSNMNNQNNQNRENRENKKNSQNNIFTKITQNGIFTRENINVPSRILKHIHGS